MTRCGLENFFGVHVYNFVTYVVNKMNIGVLFHYSLWCLKRPRGVQVGTGPNSKRILTYVKNKILTPYITPFPLRILFLSVFSLQGRNRKIDTL